jgi:NAD+ diphosphatase
MQTLKTAYHFEMLQTPATFTPVITRPASPDAYPDPLNFVFHGSRLLVRESDGALPHGPLLLDPARVQPVGLLDGRYCQAAWVDHESEAPDGYGFAHIRQLMFGGYDEALVGVAARAVQIAEWARTHRYCGACAQPMVQLPGERCFQCTACKHMAYPRISPAMMVLIRKGDSYLMALHTKSPAQRFTPLAGFLEAGESVEEAVHREVFEEVGLRVHNLKYFASQSWPFPHSLMLAFTADYLEGEIRIDTSELSEARWFGPNDVWPERVPHISISSLLVDAHRPG